MYMGTSTAAASGDPSQPGHTIHYNMVFCPIQEPGGQVADPWPKVCC